MRPSRRLAEREPRPLLSVRRPGYEARRLILRFLAALAVGASLCVSRACAEPQTPIIKVVALGDSLTAGYLLPAEAAFPAVLERALRTEGFPVTVVNAGVSGDTASGGLARLDWSLGEGADGVILELGANDMLRGTDPQVTKTALDSILARLEARKVKVLIAGMRATQNLGADYKKRFDAIYPELAAKYRAVLYPFFLDGVVNDPRLNLSDGMHPNETGVASIVQHMLPTARTFLHQLVWKHAAAGPSGPEAVMPASEKNMP